MLPLPLIAPLLIFAGSELSSDGVNVKVEVSAQLYTWTVQNEGGQPIDSFTLDTFNTYNHAAPEGWQIDASDDRFRAWTDHRHRAIQPNRSAEFSARVSSFGAVLGEETISIRRVGEDPVAIGTIWAPVRRPLNQYILIPAVILALALLHFALVVRSTAAHRAAGDEVP